MRAATRAATSPMTDDRVVRRNDEDDQVDGTEQAGPVDVAGVHGMSSHGDDRSGSWLDSPTHLNVLHRAGAVLLGLGLWVFGILGLVNRLDMFSTRGQPILGLSSNGLLSIISLVVGAILITAAVRGGRLASTIMVAVGAAFMLSGLGNVLVLNTNHNFLAFGISNVIFSLVAGGLLLILGAWGRFTVGLPSNNPYEQERHPEAGTGDVMPTIYPAAATVRAATDLAEAERAAARGGATPEQAKGVAAAGRARRAEDRVAGWQSDQEPPPS